MAFLFLAFLAIALLSMGSEVEARDARQRVATEAGTGNSPPQPAGLAAQQPVAPQGAWVRPAVLAPPVSDASGHAGAAASAANVPAEPVAASAHAVLERHCARCHEAGRLAPDTLVSGDIANILSLDALARMPALVKPGEPDGSLLFQVMAARQMPPELRRPMLGAAVSHPPQPATANGSPLQHASSGNGAEHAEPASGTGNQPTAAQTGPPHPEGPDAAELMAVRKWIQSLPRGTGCGREWISPDKVVSDVGRWLDKVGVDGAPDVRFVSLANLANRCASEAELAAARDGVARLLNSLSWSKSAATVETVGDDLVLLAFRLSELGWTREHWEMLVARMPATARLQSFVGAARTAGRGDEEERVLATRRPVVPADWLALTARDPDVYARLLGLPGTIDELGALLHVSLDDKRESRDMRRAAVSHSAETGAPRVIEHYAGRHGSLWIGYDFPTDTAPLDLLDHPLQPWTVATAETSGRSQVAGAEAGAGSDSAAEADQPETSTGSSIIFTLPNGLPGFAAFDADGRIRSAASARRGPANPADAAAADAATHEDDAPEASPAGPRCMACHALGALPFQDELATHVDGTSYGGSDIEHDIAKPTLFASGETQKRVGEDRRALGASAFGSAFNAAPRLDGRDAVEALAVRWWSDVDLRGAAAETGIEPEQLLRRLDAASDNMRALGLRLRQSRISRAEVEQLATALSAPGGISGSGQVPLPDNAGDDGLELALWATEPGYVTGEAVQLKARASAPCHLTIVNIDRRGDATVLFPNEFDRDNLMKPGQEIAIPAKDASYRFRFRVPGEETFVAICEVGEPVPAGIRPDFTKQNFSPLGPWEEFVGSAHAAARLPRVPLDNGADPDARFRRTRRGSGQPAPRPAPDGAPEQVRAAIRLVIGG
mgnify:FL=1